MQDTVGQYLSAIGKIPMLTAAEEIHQAQLIRTWLDWPEGEAPKGIQRRGQRAVRRFMEGNLRLVISLARKNELRGKSVGLELIDLIQEGNIGLSTAARKFDPELGYKFSTYAYWWIRQALSRAIESGNTIRIPTNILQAVNRLKKVTSQTPGASFEDICVAARLEPEGAKFLMAVDHLRSLASLDASVNRPSDTTAASLAELLPDNSQTNPLEVLQYEELLDKVRAELPDEFALIELHLEHLFKGALSNLIGETRQRTRNKVEKSRRNLRAALELHGARELLAS